MIASTIAPLDVMQRYLDAAMSGDWDTGFGFFADDIALHVPGRSEFAASTAASRSQSTTSSRLGLTSEGAEVELELIDMLASEERVALLVRERFTAKTASSRSAARTSIACRARRSSRSGSSRRTSTRSTSCWAESSPQLGERLADVLGQLAGLGKSLATLCPDLPRFLVVLPRFSWSCPSTSPSSPRRAWAWAPRAPSAAT